MSYPASTDVLSELLVVCCNGGIKRVEPLAAFLWLTLDEEFNELHIKILTLLIINRQTKEIGTLHAILAVSQVKPAAVSDACALVKPFVHFDLLVECAHVHLVVGVRAGILRLMLCAAKIISSLISPHAGKAQPPAFRIRGTLPG